MEIITDNTEYAETLFPSNDSWKRILLNRPEDSLRALFHYFFNTDDVYECKTTKANFGKYILLVDFAPESQYDILVKLNNSGKTIPHGTVCLAQGGQNFHGFRNRPWQSLVGNLHLSIFFSPDQSIDRFASAFLILPVISVIQTLDSIPELTDRAHIKWVNDIVIENAKVCGVQAHTVTEGKKVTAVVVGIGLNVETKPTISGNVFTPETASLFDFITNRESCSQKNVLQRLLDALAYNYQSLLAGDYHRLLAEYRARSLIIGRYVRVHPLSDNSSGDKIVEGIVNSIGNHLELFLDSVAYPITKGRLELLD